jgi:hypothetical protein
MDSVPTQDDPLDKANAEVTGSQEQLKDMKELLDEADIKLDEKDTELNQAKLESKTLFDCLPAARLRRDPFGNNDATSACEQLKELTEKLRTSVKDVIGVNVDSITRSQDILELWELVQTDQATLQQSVELISLVASRLVQEKIELNKAKKESDASELTLEDCLSKHKLGTLAGTEDAFGNFDAELDDPAQYACSMLTTVTDALRKTLKTIIAIHWQRIEADATKQMVELAMKVRDDNATLEESVELIQEVVNLMVIQNETELAALRQSQEFSEASKQRELHEQRWIRVSVMRTTDTWEFMQAASRFVIDVFKNAVIVKAELQEAKAQIATALSELYSHIFEINDTLPSVSDVIKNYFNYLGERKALMVDIFEGQGTNTQSDTRELYGEIWKYFKGFFDWALQVNNIETFQGVHTLTVQIFEDVINPLMEANTWDGMKATISSLATSRDERTKQLCKRVSEFAPLNSEFQKVNKEIIELINRDTVEIQVASEKIAKYNFLQQKEAAMQKQLKTSKEIQNATGFKEDQKTLGVIHQSLGIGNNIIEALTFNDSNNETATMKETLSKQLQQIEADAKTFTGKTNEFAQQRQQLALMIQQRLTSTGRPDVAVKTADELILQIENFTPVNDIIARYDTTADVQLTETIADLAKKAETLKSALSNFNGQLQSLESFFTTTLQPYMADQKQKLPVYIRIMMEAQKNDSSEMVSKVKQRYAIYQNLIPLIDDEIANQLIKQSARVVEAYKEIAATTLSGDPFPQIETGILFAQIRDAAAMANDTGLPRWNVFAAMANVTAEILMEESRNGLTSMQQDNRRTETDNLLNQMTADTQEQSYQQLMTGFAYGVYWGIKSVFGQSVGNEYMNVVATEYFKLAEWMWVDTQELPTQQQVEMDNATYINLMQEKNTLLDASLAAQMQHEREKLEQQKRTWGLMNDLFQQLNNAQTFAAYQARLEEAKAQRQAEQQAARSYEPTFNNEQSLYQRLDVEMRETFVNYYVQTCDWQTKVTKCFRKLSLQYHPDKNGNTREATERFKRINGFNIAFIEKGNVLNYDSSMVRIIDMFTNPTDGVAPSVLTDRIQEYNILTGKQVTYNDVFNVDTNEEI